MYGDIAVLVLERNWQGRSEPYRYVNRLKPGERWHDAKVSSNPQKNPARERYVQLPEGSIPPGALPPASYLPKAPRSRSGLTAGLAVLCSCHPTSFASSSQENSGTSSRRSKQPRRIDGRAYQMLSRFFPTVALSCEI